MESTPLHVVRDGDPVPGLAHVPGFLQDLDPTPPLFHELPVVGHPGVLEGVGLAVDQVLISGPDIVGELELDVLVAEVILEEYFGQGCVGHVLVPVQIPQGETPAASEPAADAESPRH